jgi:type IV secretory pathway VirB9-like protein
MDGSLNWRNKVKTRAILALACWTISGQAAETKIVAAEPSTTSRTIAFHSTDIPAISTQMRYTTLVQLAAGEKIVLATCGDKDYWSVESAENFLLVKPGKVGARTNINVITSAGNVYSFAVREISDVSGASADLKVFVTPSDGMTQPTKAPVLFVSVSDVEVYKKAAADAQTALERTKAQATEQARETQEKSLRHDFSWDRNSKAAAAFGVKSIYHDGQFTYIEAITQEAAALYELKDGKSFSLIQYEYRNGMYIVPKILDAGSLRVGKLRLDFKREAAS